jgi:hypothetical protein
MNDELETSVSNLTFIWDDDDDGNSWDESGIDDGVSGNQTANDNQTNSGSPSNMDKQNVVNQNNFVPVSTDLSSPAETTGNHT